MLLQESRHAARTSPTGELILLENQDRSLWNREQIAEGVALVEKALKSHRFGSYTLQAAIAAVHSEAESAAVTDWRQIVALYNRLARIQPSPVVERNRAVAIAMRDGPESVWRLSTRCWHMANWQIISWRIQLVPICAAGSAGQLKLGPLMRKLWR
jgi:RNA polymerase sigma-70 factor, ECF subfamily